MDVVQQHIGGSKRVEGYIQRKKVLCIVEISFDIDYTGIVGISEAGLCCYKNWQVCSREDFV